MSRFLISAAHKSSGKTTVTVGLCAALSARGLTVQPFKKGPDYIDPMWLTQACGRACFNLDPYLTTSEQITECFIRHGSAADISIVEGNKGLYDGLALDGSNSNAALAHLLDLPVVLVLDARGMTRGIAPLILGYQAFDRRIRIAGVILNQLGGSRHESKLRAVIEHYTDVAVLGAIGHDARLAVVERHLGLMPNHELDDAAQRVRAIGELVGSQVDLSRVLHVGQETPPLPTKAVAEISTEIAKPRVRIGFARDKAFGFYYSDDLLAFARSGADLIPFDTLKDQSLPDVDGLFIGGGFPEMFMPDLQANGALRSAIRNAVEAGMPVYAECGGLMYLARSLRWQDRVYDMIGAIGADVVMHDRPVGRGYVELESTGKACWPCAGGEVSNSIRGHEFHYSDLENLDPNLEFAYRVKRGHGVNGRQDGIIYRHVLASYAHLRDGAGSNWVSHFVDFVRSHKASSRRTLTAARSVQVNGCAVLTDVEGYLTRLDDWSAEFVLAQAQSEELELTEGHWQVIEFLRGYYQEHQVQAQVRTMISHFSRAWGPERGNNHHLHALFPKGGPQKQGNRLAGLMKTKGEH